VVEFEDGRKIRDHAEGVYSPPASALPPSQPLESPTQANQRV
jgi:hypothetical protein